MATNGREEESTAAAADAAIWRQRLLKCWNFVLVNKFLFLSLLGVAGGWERFENLIDRCNTVVNVFSDCIGVSIIYEVSKKELEGHRQEMIQMDFSNAADVAPDQIQVHFSDRESENESLHTPPENPFSEFSDAAEQLDPNPSS